MMEQTVGITLRLAREEKKISLEQVYQATKIRLGYLRAIENDAFDELPSRAQARGFIRLYAEYLGLDPFALLDSIHSVPATQPEVVIPMPSQESANPSEPDEKETNDLFSQKKKGAFQGKVKDSSQKIQDSFQQLTDKIPYRIVKKSDSSQTVTAAIETPISQSTPSQPVGVQNNYQAMSKALGYSLRARRESLGLSLADVERQTRIREIYLYALEEGNLNDLPSTVQGRGMLGNYAAFMGLDSEAFLSRFAEALQQKRLETVPEKEAGIPLPTSNQKQPLTGWRRLISPDLVFTGGIFLVFFVLIIWGAVQLVGIKSNTVSPTVIPISDVLLASGTPSSSALVTIEGSTPQTSAIGVSGFTPVDNLQATLSATNSNAIQLVIVAHHRAFMKITVDGKDFFNGRVVPGMIYSYTGNTSIVLLTGDGSALEAYYNQTALGILGITSQVVNLQFSPKGYINLGADYTATPAPTMIPSLTPNPTATATQTPIPGTPTIIPASTGY
jgi:cytoskeleton protein RodZ